MENASDWHQAHQNRSIRLGAMTLWRQVVKIGMGKSHFLRRRTKNAVLFNPITSLFLDRFLNFWHVSDRASKMQVNATNRIEIGGLVWELWHFLDKWPKLEWENQASTRDWHPTPHNSAFSWLIFDFLTCTLYSMFFFKRHERKSNYSWITKDIFNLKKVSERSLNALFFSAIS